ncbi:MAG: antitoxin VapB family protein [Longimicrobiales bacterium]
MATKTISVDLDAYERLRRARRGPSESFSQVIKRATWPAGGCTAGELLAALAQARPTEQVVLERLERGQREDRAPGDPWRAP